MRWLKVYKGLEIICKVYHKFSIPLYRMCRKYLLNIFVWLCLITLPLALGQEESDQWSQWDQWNPWSVRNKEGKLIDCRKYPFAPVCRGAGAKRLYLYSPQEINYEDLAEEILDSNPIRKRKLYVS